MALGFAAAVVLVVVIGATVFVIGVACDGAVDCVVDGVEAAAVGCVEGALDDAFLASVALFVEAVSDVLDVSDDVDALMGVGAGDGALPSAGKAVSSARPTL